MTTYKINRNQINKFKKEAKSIYKTNAAWMLKKDYRVMPPELGVSFSDCTLHYKSDGIISFKGYYLYIHKTKDRIKV